MNRNQCCDIGHFGGSSPRDTHVYWQRMKRSGSMRWSLATSITVQRNVRCESARAYFFFILPESCVLCHSAVRIREVTRSNSCVSFAARTWKSRLGVLTLPLPTAKVYMFGRCSPQDRVSLHCSFQNDAAVLDTRFAIRKNTECLTVPDNVRDPVSSIDCTAESTAVATLQHSLKKKYRHLF